VRHACYEAASVSRSPSKAALVEVLTESIFEYMTQGGCPPTRALAASCHLAEFLAPTVEGFLEDTMHAVVEAAQKAKQRK